MGSIHGSNTIALPNELQVRYCSSRRLLVDNNGVVYPLRNQSLEVLRFLAENHDTIQSKATIHETIWHTVAVTDDSLVQCISEIRKALKDTNRTLLQTFPRQGYLLTEVAFVSEHRIDDLENGVDRVKISPFKILTNYTINLHKNLIQTSAVLALGTISVLALSELMSTDSFSSGESKTRQIASYDINGMRTSQTLPSELNQRDYRENGMPFWNNRFLWDGYYKDDQ